MFKKFLFLSEAVFFMSLAPLFFSTGCTQNAFLRGLVSDISGEELPGVIVRVVDTEYEGLSNANGVYSFRAGSGSLQLEFSKTGYTSAYKSVEVPSLGVIDIDTVQLWPVPISEGVYVFQNYRYSQMEHPRVNRYNVQDAGFAYGTPVEPGLTISSLEIEPGTDVKLPRLLAYKMPTYDVHLHKLKKVKALIAQAGAGGRGEKARKEIPYDEEVWIPDEPIQLISLPVDEPSRLLMVLRPVEPLAQGVYAIHWRSLEGYDGIDPRAFLFAVSEVVPGTEGEGEKEGEEEEKHKSNSPRDN
jgi:hypothetical protein